MTATLSDALAAARGVATTATEFRAVTAAQLRSAVDDFLGETHLTQSGIDLLTERVLRIADHLAPLPAATEQGDDLLAAVIGINARPAGMHSVRAGTTDRRMAAREQSLAERRLG